MSRLADLEAMDRAALVAAWSDLFGSPPPRGISKPFLRRFLAFELQARASGGLPRRLKAALGKEEATARSRKRHPGLKPGGRLLREWNGRTHVIDVTAEGYRWEGKTWRSLSVIAREITGTNWSGPRFFGLNGTASR